MSKEKTLELLKNGMTVGDLIRKLERYDRNMLVINTRSDEYLPVDSVTKTTIDYCFDEIISKEVISIW